MRQDRENRQDESIGFLLKTEGHCCFFLVQIPLMMGGVPLIYFEKL